MSSKLSPDGHFVPFRGWTTISPVRHPKTPSRGLQSQSQSVWTNLLAAASKMIRSSPCSANFACLPEESLHMTLTGLTEEQTGLKPVDMQSAPWPEVEAALIQRSVPSFEENSLKSIACHARVDPEDEPQAEKRAVYGVRMKFVNIVISSIIWIELAAVTPEMDDILYQWKTNLLKATGLGAKIEKQGQGMPYHVTLAYRVLPSGDMKDKERALQSALKKLFESSSWTVPELLLNPPSFCSFPDMLQFPTHPLYPINQPLHFLLKNAYRYDLVATEPNFDLLAGNPLSLYSMNLKRNPTTSPYSIDGCTEHISSQAPNKGSSAKTAFLPSIGTSSAPNSSSNSSCAIVILGRALENGKVTETLVNRLCRGFQVYMETKASRLFANTFIILCGGYTAKGYEISEAMAMKNWLLSKFVGISSGDFILEENSLTTIENAIFVRNLLLEHPELVNCTHLKLVTTQSHINRSSFLFLNLLCMPQVSMESISCLDADPSDEAVEAHKSRSDYPTLLKRSLAFHCTAFFRSSIHESVKRNLYDHLKQFITSNCDGIVPSPLDLITDMNGNTALHFSVIHRRPKCLALLLQSGANVFCRNHTEKTALDLALAQPDLNIISIIFAHLSRQSPVISGGFPQIPSIKDLPMSVPNSATAAAMYLMLAPFQAATDRPQAFIVSLSSSYESESLLLASHVLQHRLNLPYLKIAAFTQRNSVAAASFIQRFLDSDSPTSIVHPGTPQFEFSTQDQLTELVPKKPKHPIIVVLDSHIVTPSTKFIPFATLGYDVYYIHL